MSNPRQLPLLDAADVRILELLQRDAQIENQELARRVHLSPAACLRRVRRLRETGIIARTVALLDPRQLGLNIQACAFVALENHRASSGRQFESVVLRRPEIIECTRLSGAYDYLLRIAVETMEKYSALLDEHLLPLPAVRSISTSFELGTLKRTTELPLPAPAGKRRLPRR